MTNPFRIPGPEEDPVRPLCPWEEDSREHSKYYADVDHTAESFARFTAQLVNVTGMLKNGRLIVVAGQKGCGKTSLINRCVHWMQTELLDRNKGQGLVVEVIDLTRVSDSSRGVTERMTEVSSRLADEVKMKNLATDEALLKDVIASAGQPETLYPRLSHALNDKMILVVLLPPIELLPLTPQLQEEIRSYNRYADANVVFFMEATLAEDPEGLSLRAGAATPPLVLPVRTLNSGDGVVFASVRLKLHTSGEVFPQLDLAAQRKIVEKKRSVKFVQNLLYNVYEERRLTGHNYTDNDLVTFSDITEFFYRSHEGDVPGTGF